MTTDRRRKRIEAIERIRELGFRTDPASPYWYLHPEYPDRTFPAVVDVVWGGADPIRTAEKLARELDRLQD